MITSNLSFRLWYILWNPRWKASTTWYVWDFFVQRYHCKIIIVCTDVLFVCFSIAKVGLSRKNIVLKHMLGEGFFGEVHEGVYHKKASSTTHFSHVMMQWKLQCFCRSNLDFSFYNTFCIMVLDLTFTLAYLIIGDLAMISSIFYGLFLFVLVRMGRKLVSRWRPVRNVHLMSERSSWVKLVCKYKLFSLITFLSNFW